MCLTVSVRLYDVVINSYDSLRYRYIAWRIWSANITVVHKTIYMCGPLLIVFNSYFHQQFVTISNLCVLIGVHSAVFLPINVTRLASRVFSDQSKAKSYLVDSASSHMLVSKIKPCMSQYMPY